jgi:hypothetical protein
MLQRFVVALGAVSIVLAAIVCVCTHAIAAAGSSRALWRPMASLRCLHLWFVTPKVCVSEFWGEFYQLPVGLRILTMKPATALD